MNIKRILDSLQLRVFFCNGTFVPLLSSLAQSLKWKEDKEQDAVFTTDGLTIFYEPEKVMNTDSKILFAEYIRILWHVARLHNLRGKNRDENYWEVSCDLVVDADLVRHSHQYGNHWNLQFPLTYEQYNGWPEEKIYDDIWEEMHKPQQQGYTSKQIDIKELTEWPKRLRPSPSDAAEKQQLLNVQKAVQQAKLAGSVNTADIDKIIDSFNKPKISWSKELKQFFIDRAEPEDITWRRPNRRYQDMYLPSRDSTTGRLTHLMYFIDVSGSITEQDIEQFLAEVHDVFTSLAPEKLTVCSFNTRIIDRFDFTQDDRFKKLQFKIGGGTSYRGIYDILIQEHPAAAVIFTDLNVNWQMDAVKGVPVIWVVNGDYNKAAQIKTGRIIHIEPEG